MAAFDDIPVLSTFTGDENPLVEGGNWLTVPFQPGGVQSQKLGGTARFTSGESQSPWFAVFDRNVSAYMTVVALPAVGNSVVIIARADPAKINTANYTYYQVILDNAGFLFIARNLNGGFLQITPVTTPAPGLVAGDKIGIICQESWISSWYNKAASPGWQMHEIAYDTTIPTGGHIGFALRATTQLDDFGGGNTPMSGKQAPGSNRIGPF